MSKKTMGATIATAALGVLALLSTGAAPANAANDDQQLEKAQAVFESVLSAPDPAQALQRLTSTERALFDYYGLPARTEVTTSWEAPTAAEPAGGEASSVHPLAVTCSNFRQNGEFYSNGGVKLGSFWTVGQGCRNGATVTSVAYIDGGGQTHQLGWEYRGRQTNKGIAGNVGKVYGQYAFRLNVGGIIVESKQYCARTIHTSATTYGDGVCGL